ncbi:hypothetical protein F2Q69_00013092 [Brassica cretica]|uniref:Uncharacterized protein n=1 Tax=Brassica cretica TaxID=69181 RepID=A0A8S9R7I3_BRACR|nr:hypothetical protein F2Q69_00013092 [Brassica cretica]
MFTQIAKDVTKPRRFDTEPVRSQLRDDFLLGCDQGKRKAEASEPHGKNEIY